MRISDPAIDLGIACAVVSSMNNKPLGDNLMIIGEIGLTGEIRGVTNVLQRVKEAAKMGFGRCIIPKSNYDKDMEKLGMKIETVSGLTEALGLI
jgi:DNA repair protein RadA/Sms